MIGEKVNFSVVCCREQSYRCLQVSLHYHNRERLIKVDFVFSSQSAGPVQNKWNGIIMEHQLSIRRDGMDACMIIEKDLPAFQPSRVRSRFLLRLRRRSQAPVKQQDLKE